MALRQLLLFSFLLTTAIITHGQSNYRIKTKNETEYLLPPHTKINFKGKTANVKNKFKFVYIYLKNLSKDYGAFIKSFENAETWHGSTNYFVNSSKEIGQAVSNQKAATCSFKSEERTFFKFACLDMKGERFFIQVDIEKLNQTSPLKNYDEFAIDFLKAWASKEGTNACGCANSITWPNGVGVELLNKFKEWMPIPVGARLAYSSFTIRKDEYSFVFLNSSIVLRVDDVTKATQPGNKFVYEWDGSNLFSFDRDGNGTYIQNKFGMMKTGLPNNLIDNNSNGRYQLSSFADIQNSSALRNYAYMGLLHPVIKRNNNVASDMGKYGASTDSKPETGNALLVHIQSSGIQSIDLTDTDFDEDENYAKSTFGPRHSIEPLVPVFVNEREERVDITDNPDAIEVLPADYTLFRKYGSDYRKVKGKKTNLFLLAFDHFKYKL